MPKPFRHLILIPFAGRVGTASLPKTAASEPRPCVRRTRRNRVPARYSPTGTVLRSPSVRPAIKVIDQSGSDWIFTNVNPSGLEIRLTADSVIEVVALPDNSELRRCITLPIFDEIHHSVTGVPAEGHQGMKVIGHDYSEINLPAVALMIEFQRAEKSMHGRIVGELIRATFLAVDRDKKR